jgi:hypothetical protein
MSAAQAMPVESQDLARGKLSTQILTIMRILGAGCEKGSLHAFAAGGRSALYAPSVDIPVGSIGRTLLPHSLLRAYETSASPWRLSLAIHDGPSSVSSLSALSVTWRLRSGLVKHHFIFDYAAPLAAIKRFGIEASVLLQAGDELAAVWALTQPIPASHDGEQARACLLLRALAARLGATVPAPGTPLEAWSLPLIGTANPGASGVAVALSLQPQNVYPVAAIERAVARVKE